jgi:hypothetical protein
MEKELIIEKPKSLYDYRAELCQYRLNLDAERDSINLKIQAIDTELERLSFEGDMA